jgi:hypothetical protein
MSWCLAAWCLHGQVQTAELVAVGRGPRHLVADQVPAGRAPRCQLPGARAADQVTRAGDPGPQKTARVQAARV